MTNVRDKALQEVVADMRADPAAISQSLGPYILRWADRIEAALSHHQGFGMPHSMDADMVRERIRDKMRNIGLTQADYAAMGDYSASYLNDFLEGRRKPGPKILDAEGLVAVIYYEYKI